MRTADIRTIRTRYGMFAIDVVSDAKMARALESGVYPNEGLLVIARQFITPGSVVLDIGAHIGTFAVPIANEAGKVIAFEPSPEAFSLLSRNAAEHGGNMLLVNKALGRTTGNGSIIVRKESNAGANTIVPGGDIPISTVDSEVTHADFIKIDVEGMELQVLSGGAQLIERSRPVIMFEVNLSQLRAHHTSPRALERFFARHGYWIYVPLEQKNGALARVLSATLLTAFIAPRAWIFFSESAPFDLVAIPQERVLPEQNESFGVALWCALKNNLSVKFRRARVLLRR